MLVKIFRREYRTSVSAEPGQMGVDYSIDEADTISEKLKELCILQGPLNNSLGCPQGERFLWFDNSNLAQIDVKGTPKHSYDGKYDKTVIVRFMPKIPAGLTELLTREGFKD